LVVGVYVGLKDRRHIFRKKNAVYLQNFLVFLIYPLLFTAKWRRDKRKEKW